MAGWPRMEGWRMPFVAAGFYSFLSAVAVLVALPHAAEAPPPRRSRPPA